jgi:hypothetical protein
MRFHFIAQALYVQQLTPRGATNLAPKQLAPRRNVGAAPASSRFNPQTMWQDIDQPRSAHKVSSKPHATTEFCAFLNDYTRTPRDGRSREEQGDRKLVAACFLNITKDSPIAVGSAGFSSALIPKNSG